MIVALSTDDDLATRWLSAVTDLCNARQSALEQNTCSVTTCSDVIDARKSLPECLLLTTAVLMTKDYHDDYYAMDEYGDEVEEDDDVVVVRRSNGTN